MLPASLPFVFAALRVGLVRAINAMITAELFLAAVNLGALMKHSAQRFDTAGLLAALEWQASQFQTQTGIVCEVKAEMKETLGNQELNTAFFRIFQEALTNIIRHAKATKVEVRLAEVSGHVVLEVQDNGRGISRAEIHNTKSIGLLGIRERAALLGGTLRIEGERDKGTTLTARIPKTSVARPR